MYNPRDEQAMTSHKFDRLQLTPQAAGARADSRPLCRSRRAASALEILLVRLTSAKLRRAMGSLIQRRLAACFAAALIAVPCSTHRELFAQSAAARASMRIVALAEAKMKEYGVPGVALGIVATVCDHARAWCDQRRGSAARHRAHRVPHRLDLQDLRGDRDDAARRAGQGRPSRAGADLSARLPRPRRSREPRRHRVAPVDAPRRVGRAGVRPGPGHRDAQELRLVASPT